MSQDPAANMMKPQVNERRTKERELQMKTAQLQQQAAQLRIQAQTQEHLAINSFRAANSAASNNIMLAGVGVSYRIDSMHVAVPSGVVSVALSEETVGLCADRKSLVARP